MNVEIGESIVYSWLRHVKGCQIAQNNWKVSPYWELKHDIDLCDLKNEIEKKYAGRYNVFKKNSGIPQILAQSECDAIGLCFNDQSIYGIDVAFHKNGLNYGHGRTATVAKVLEKLARTAMCFCGYLDRMDAEVIFISPKIGEKIYKELLSALEELQDLTNRMGYKFHFSVIANEDFTSKILDPIGLVTKKVDDTIELFLRSYQLIELFKMVSPITKKKESGTTTSAILTSATSSYSTFKIGQLAQVVLKDILESGTVKSTEIAQMQTKEYSKLTFDLQYPVLTKVRNASNSMRYYANPVVIGKDVYYLCSQWFETTTNNDRPFLEAWIDEH